MSARSLALAVIAAAFLLPATLPASAGKKIILKGNPRPVEVVRCTVKRICYPVNGGGQRCEDVKLCTGPSSTI